MTSHASTRTISEVTRRAVFDYLSVGPQWSGRLPEDDFLGRLYDLKRMPSTDYRSDYDNAAKDIAQHRVRNLDWPHDWVFTDERFDLLFGPDEAFLKFLVETIHPVVRTDASECESMVREYNSALAPDGWEIFPTRTISDRPVFSFRRMSDSSQPHLEEASKVAERLTGVHVAQQVRRLRESVDKDPDLAIGTSKEFLETLCKEILAERNVSVAKDIEFPALVKTTVKNLNVLPAHIVDQSLPAKSVSALLGNLSAIGHQMAEIRNQFGTGHGRNASHIGLHRRHAKLAVGAATTLAVFLYECHEADLAKPS